jgi:DNA-binding transcriptional regulator YiaG
MIRASEPPIKRRLACESVTLGRDAVISSSKLCVSTKIVVSQRTQSCQQKLLKMTPAQCRAARALLDLTQSELARAADLGLSTVVDFEKQRRLVSEEAVKAIRRALEQSGIEFLDGDPGPGLRLRKPSRRR